MVKPAKFTRDSGCLTPDEFLVISGPYVDIHFVFLFLFLGTVMHCSSSCGISSRELIRINFGITF